MRARLLLPLLAGLLLPAALGAQEADPSELRTGARVRASVPSLGSVKGRLVLAEPSRLVLRTRDGERTLPMDSVTSLEVGRLDRWAGLRRGALIGAAVGPVAWTGLCFAGDSCVADDLNEGWKVGLLVGVGSVVGAVAGGTLGAVTGRERWTPVEVPVRARAAVAPARGGGVVVGVAVGL